MSDFLFIFFRSPIDETDDAAAARNEKWQNWVDANRSSIRDAGGLLGSAWTVSQDDETFLGREYPSTAYMIVRARSKEHALSLAATCPEVALGGSIEVAELHRDEPDAENVEALPLATIGPIANHYLDEDKDDTSSKRRA